MEHMLIQWALLTREIGNLIVSMGKGLRSGLMGQSTKGLSLKETNKDLANLYGCRMGHITKESG